MSIDVLAVLVAWYSLGAIATMWVGAAAHIRNGDRLQDMMEEACRVEPKKQKRKKWELESGTPVIVWHDEKMEVELSPIYVTELLRDPAFLPTQLVEIEGIPANQMGIYKGRKVLLKSESDS